jgi:hypothetical protein
VNGWLLAGQGRPWSVIYVDEKHILVGGFKQFLFSIMLG